MSTLCTWDVFFNTTHLETGLISDVIAGRIELGPEARTFHFVVDAMICMCVYAVVVASAVIGKEKKTRLDLIRIRIRIS